MGSERPENCPVDSFQWRTGGSPGKGAATIEVAEESAASLYHFIFPRGNSLIRVKPAGEPLSTASGGNLERGEVNRKGAGSIVWSCDH